jgi:DNA anti-recombination protein RmuC
VVENPNDTTRDESRRDPVKELQARLEAAIDEVRPKIRRALDELDARMDEAVADIRPKAQNAMQEVRPKVDQFVADMQPRLDTLLQRLQGRIEELRKDLDERATRSARTDAPAGTLPPLTDPTAGGPGDEGTVP